MTIRTPSVELVERIAGEEAARASVSLVQVLGVERRQIYTHPRKRAWVRLVVEEGFPVLGVAMTWGCHRRGIQRALREAEAQVAA